MWWKRVMRWKNEGCEDRPCEGAMRGAGLAGALILSLLLSALTSCVATRESNLGPLTISSFTASIWDNDLITGIILAPYIPSPDPNAPPIQSPTINPGEKIVLAWAVSGTTSITVSDENGPLQSSAFTVLTGSQIVVTPMVTTTYTLTATGLTGPSSLATNGAPTTITVNVVPPPVISNFTATPSSILAGQSTTLSWTATNAKTLSILGYDATHYSTNGGKLPPPITLSINVTGQSSQPVAPSISTVYALSAVSLSDGTGMGGTNKVTTTVQVTPVLPSTVSLQASNSSITPGTPILLTWTATNFSTLTLQAVDANHPSPGVQTVLQTNSNGTVPETPSITTTYTLVATNVAGTTYSSVPVTVTVTSCPAPNITQFTANPVSTGSGGTVNLTAVFDIGTAAIENVTDNLPITVLPVTVNSGQEVTTPSLTLTSSKTYQLTVTNTCGATSAQSTATTRVPVGSISLFGGSIKNGSGTTLYTVGTDSDFGLTGAVNGNLYSASSTLNSGCIFEVDPTGATTPLAGWDGPTSVDPFGGSCDLFGDLDGSLNSALFDDPKGVAYQSASNSSLFPAGDNLLYVADNYNNEIRVIDLSQYTVSVLAGAGYTLVASGINWLDGQGTGALFHGPYGVALDSATGNLYVTDSLNNVIRMIDPSGNVTTIAGTPPTAADDGSGYVDLPGTQARFRHPQGITLASDGNLYVVDTYNTEAGGTGGNTINKINNVIRKIDLIHPGYNVSTIAGQPGKQGYQDGPGSSALFASIGPITSDADGNLYLPDTSGQGFNNYVIRRLRPQSDGSYWVDTIIGTQGATSLNLEGPLPGDFKIDAYGIFADPSNGELYIISSYFNGSSRVGGIYQAPY